MKKIFLYYLCISIILLYVQGCGVDTQSGNHDENDGDSFTFENNDLVLNITRVGGMLTGFYLKEKPVNPFSWMVSIDQMPENNRPHVFAGHFLCTGRWGEPSEGEKQAGIPHNGEVNTTRWEITDSSATIEGNQRVIMTCETAIEKLDVQREILLPQKGGFFIVKEAFTNNLPIGRPVNFVQHGTIAPPFLDEYTIINTNATSGFDQRDAIAGINENYFQWPDAILTDGQRVNLSNTNIPEGFVTTHIFPEQQNIGWVTAYNVKENILFGYVFKTEDYPWFNFWHHTVNGSPYVKGLEFGTTGIGKPYHELLLKDSRFMNKNSFTYIDAAEVISKTWLCFQILPDKPIGQVAQIQLTDKLYIHTLEVDGLPGKTIHLELGAELLSFFHNSPVSLAQ